MRSRLLPRSRFAISEIALRDLNVIVVLQIEPKLCRGAECLGEPKRRIGGNAGPFAGDPFDPCARQAANLGKSARRHFQRNQELLPQNLTGMHGLEFLGHCRVLFKWQSTISTSAGPSAVQTKHTRNWSLILIECCPLRSPANASRRLPGGDLKSLRSPAALR